MLVIYLPKCGRMTNVTKERFHKRKKNNKGDRCRASSCEREVPDTIHGRGSSFTVGL